MTVVPVPSASVDGCMLEGCARIFMLENSPLSGEFQKGEAYSCQKEALLCYKKVVLTSVVAKESDNG